MTDHQPADLPFRLTGSQAKTAFALRQNAERLIGGEFSRRELYDWQAGDGRNYRLWHTVEPQNLNCTGFLTLTIGDTGPDGRFHQVFDAKEASRRINNLNRRVLSALFERAIVVSERHKSGAIHFHVLGVLRGHPDIRSGLDWPAFRRAAAMRSKGLHPSSWLYRSACFALRQTWAMLREVLPRYGFGQAELMPIRKTGEAVAAYVAKYIEKNLFNRLKEDYRKKLVRYLGYNRLQLRPNDFSWASKRACAWRWKTRQTAALLCISAREQCASVFGPRWAFHLSNLWRQVDENLFPGLTCGWGEKMIMRRELARLAGRTETEDLERATRIKLGEVWSPGEWADYMAGLKN